MGGRYLIYVPEVNPRTFVFFYARGSSGRSYSVRDYTATPPTLRYAKEFPAHMTAEVILGWTNRSGNHCFSADRIRTTNVTDWRGKIFDLNASKLGQTRQPGLAQAESDIPVTQSFPILDRELFQAMPKTRKGEDVRRIFNSPNSEDWVTWNVFRLLARRPAEKWWPRILEVAQKQLTVPLDLPAPSRVDLWVSMVAPRGYEAASRARMAASDNPDWVGRALHPNPVEGPSEIDVVIRGTGYLLLAEAKLTSDVSARTTYDPARNQIVRNVDCALESAGSDLPVFWMFVKDRRQDRMYVQLIDQWRRDPSILGRALPHRDLQDIAGILDRCAVITWADALESLEPTSDEAEVWAELVRRIR